VAHGPPGNGGLILGRDALECCIGVEPVRARPFPIKKDAVPLCLSAKASQAANQVASLPASDLARAVPTLVRLNAH
jgi:hypothetical protein